MCGTFSSFWLQVETLALPGNVAGMQAVQRDGMALSQLVLAGCWPRVTGTMHSYLLHGAATQA